MVGRFGQHVRQQFVGYIALFIALGGVSYAAIALPMNSVGSKQIKRGAVKNSDLGKGAVTTGKVKDGSLLSLDFKPGQLVAGAPGATGPQGPKGDPGAKGDPGTPGAAGASGASGASVFYRSTLPISLAGTDGAIARVLPLCDAGDRATGGGYFLNTSTLTTAQRNVDIFANAPNTNGNNQNPPGWDIGIINNTTTARSGFAFAVCADLTP